MEKLIHSRIQSRDQRVLDMAKNTAYTYTIEEDKRVETLFVDAFGCELFRVVTIASPGCALDQFWGTSIECDSKPVHAQWCGLEKMYYHQAVCEVFGKRTNEAKRC